MNQKPSKKPRRKKGGHSSLGNEEAGHLKKGEVFSLEENLEKKLSLRFRYWRGWMIDNVTQRKGAVFPNIDLEYVNSLKEKFISSGSAEAFDELKKEAPWAIKDPRVVERMYELQHKTKIELNKIGTYRGSTKTDKLREVIKKDFNSFKELVAKRREGRTVQDITKDSTDALVWRRYIKPARLMLQAFGSDEHSDVGWEYVYRCFETMAVFINPEHPHSAVFLNAADPTILLLRSDAVVKDGLSIYHP